MNIKLLLFLPILAIMASVFAIQYAGAGKPLWSFVILGITTYLICYILKKELN